MFQGHEDHLAHTTSDLGGQQTRMTSKQLAQINHLKMSLGAVYGRHFQL